MHNTQVGSALHCNMTSFMMVDASWPRSSPNPTSKSMLEVVCLAEITAIHPLYRCKPSHQVRKQKPMPAPRVGETKQSTYCAFQQSRTRNPRLYPSAYATVCRSTSTLRASATSTTPLTLFMASESWADNHS